MADWEECGLKGTSGEVTECLSGSKTRLALLWGENKESVSLCLLALSGSS